MQTTTHGLPRLHGEQAPSHPKRLPSNEKRSVMFAPRNTNVPGSFGGGGLLLTDEQQTQHSRPQSTPGTSKFQQSRSSTNSITSIVSPLSSRNAPNPRQEVGHTVTHDDPATSMNYTGALEVLQGENDVLRNTIQQLHAKLLEKMRGANKVVGGGQFRVMITSPGNTTIAKRPPESSGCHRCSLFRKESSRLTHELDQLSEVYRELREYVDALEKQQQVWNSEREAQRIEIKQLERDVSEGNQERALVCAKRDFIQQQLDALQLAYSSLKADLAEVCAQNKVGEPATEPTNTDLHDATTQTIVEDCSQNTKRDLELVVRQLAIAQRQVDETRNVLEGERLRRQNETFQYEQNQNNYELEAKSMKNEIQILKRTKQQLGEELEKRSQETILLEKNHIDAIGKLTRRIEMLANECRVKEDNERHIYTACERLKQHVKQLEMKNCHVEDQVAQLTVEIIHKDEQLCACRLELEKFGAIINEFRTEASSHISNAKKLENTKQLLEKAELSLSEANKELNILQIRIETLESDIEERDQMTVQIQQNQARTLERALEKTLRICLVAPTVKVHMGKLTSSRKDINQREEEMIECRSQPPKKAIQESVEKDILPFFASIMIEPNQGTTKEASAVPSDLWLQTLLDKMKAQLAERIENVFAARPIVS